MRVVDVLQSLGYHVLKYVESHVVIYDSPTPVIEVGGDVRCTLLFRGYCCDVSTVRNFVEKYTPAHVLWIGARGTVLEVECRDLHDALKVLRLVKVVNFKHSGVVDVRDRGVTVSLWSMYRIDVPLKVGCEILIPIDELGRVVELINGFVARDREIVERVCSVLRHQLGRYRS